MIHRSILRTVGLLFALCVARVEAVDFVIQGSQDPVFTRSGESLTVEIAIDNDDASDAGSIQAFQMAVQHDGSLLEFSKATYEGSALGAAELNGGAGPSTYLVDENPDGVHGFTLGVIFEEQALDFVLGSGTHVVSVIEYLAASPTSDGDPTRIEFASFLSDPPIENKYTTKAGETKAAAGTTGVDVIIAGETYSIELVGDAFEASTGGTVAIPIDLVNNPVPVTGFSFGLRHDANVLDFVELRTGSGLNSVIGDLNNPALEEGSPFFALNESPDGGPGVTVALILSSSDASVVLDPADSPHRVFEAVYRGTSSGDGQVELTGGLGSPEVGIFFDLSGRSSPAVVGFPAPVVSATVTVSGEGGGGDGVSFRRGDVDQNGRLNITDARGILQILFAITSIRNENVRATAENCPIAVNVDGSLVGGTERRADISDAIALLDFLFRTGRAPSTPFPSCGRPEQSVDPAFDCKSFSCN